MFPVWERNVPFTVVNVPRVDQEALVAVGAVRRFQFSTGERAMADAITATPAGLVDFLGAGRHLEVALTASVADGALKLESTGVTVRLGRMGIRLPRPVAPRVHLTERFDDVSDRQWVELRITVPLIGIVYEYVGSFRYEIRPGEDKS